MAPGTVTLASSQTSGIRLQSFAVMVLKLGLTVAPSMDAARRRTENNGATRSSQRRTDMEFNLSPQPAFASIEQSPPGLADERLTHAADVHQRGIAVLNRLLEQTTALRDLYRRANLQASGASCHELHLLFDKHHGEQERIATMLAERVRALGGLAFALIPEVDEYASLECSPSPIETPYDKLERLAEAHERLLVEAQPLGREAGSLDNLEIHDMIRREVVRTNARQIWFVTRLLSPLSDTSAAAIFN